ncbi:MAG: valine--tRNA ligase [Hyphomicrobiales bacterium]|nr:valine--tRNA ligase [Hyphomicrobiales bacterium]MDE2017455.1 valine--tRNA ligase [Hyphomicrobiales bacterium]
MEKTFDHAAVEARIAKLWDDSGAFRAGRPDRAQAAPYSIVIPPPNVTGNLHMGHALNNTLQDALARYWRMKGRDVLWQPGTDHAGIATQMVVERQLAAKGEDRRTLGREEFLKRVWEWKAESGGAIVNQLKRLGASCDWSRERFTMDEGLSKAVAKVFVQLHREGLIYKAKRLVNWDPKFQTAISDLEVVQVECKGSFKWTRGETDKEGAPVAFSAAALEKALAKDPNGHLYYFDYPVVDEAGVETGEVVTVATTRPETMLGDTAVAVHPENEKLVHLIGKRLRLPIVGRLIPVIGDDYADPEKGTGAVKITPAHDFNDFEVGKRHEAEGVSALNVFDAEARLLIAGNDAFADSDDEDLLSWHGHDRFAARVRVVEKIDALGLLAKIEPHAHMVPHGDRSGVPIEPWLTDQWYVDAKTLAQPALAAVRDGKTNFVPKNWEKTYFDWLENIQPWCVSRQLWWGHQIPAWYDDLGNFYVAETEAGARAEAQKKRAGDVHLRRDEDVLDTWFSSALWPFSTMGWPEETAELKRFYPTSALVTGFDIIFFWVARMMMMGLHFMHEVPFKDVYIHALVRDEKGAKMSKSKGNVIDPLELIDRYGADALRFTLAAMAAQGRDIKLSTQRVEGYRNFTTKLWNAARFASMNGCVRVAGFDPRAAKSTLSRWILGEVARATSEVAAAIEAYRFNDAAGAAYRFTWRVLCDWHLELAKPALQGADGPEKDEARAVVAYVLDRAAAMLHPFMPFLTEELWREFAAAAGQGEPVPLALSAWPDDSGLEAPDAEAEIGWLVELIEEVRSVRAEIAAPASAKPPLLLVEPSAEVALRAKRYEDTIARLARVSGVEVVARTPPGAAQMVVRGGIAALPLEGLVDLDAERARLTRERDKEKAEIAKIDAKLANPDFISRAKEEVVEENRERREAGLERIAKFEGALARLG